jgi:hypothetical protein
LAEHDLFRKPVSNFEIMLSQKKAPRGRRRPVHEGSVMTRAKWPTSRNGLPASGTLLCGHPRLRKHGRLALPIRPGRLIGTGFGGSPEIRRIEVVLPRNQGGAHPMRRRGLAHRTYRPVGGHPAARVQNHPLARLSRLTPNSLPLWPGTLRGRS